MSILTQTEEYIIIITKMQFMIFKLTDKTYLMPYEITRKTVMGESAKDNGNDSYYIAIPKMNV
jgi:hypothetical protein